MAYNGENDCFTTMQPVMANATKLRALQAALLRPLQPANSHSPRDYPVFTPSYETEPFPARHRPFSRNVAERRVHEEEEDRLVELMSDRELTRFPPGSVKCNFHVGSEAGHLFYCDGCRAGITPSEFKMGNRVSDTSNDSFGDSLQSAQSMPRRRGLLSRLIVNLKKPYSPSLGGSEASKYSGKLTVEGLKLELMKAVGNRKAALEELSRMKGSMGELGKKLENLESYCEGLKKALSEAVTPRSSGRKPETPEGRMAVGEEAMVEGFLQIASESRISVSEFVKALACHSTERQIESLNSLAYPYRLSSTSKNPKSAMYYLEAIINQLMYENFENRAFERNGAAKQLDIEADREAQFASFVKLRKIGCNEALRKGTRSFSEEFNKFCDGKMSCIGEKLCWREGWPEKLRELFFVMAKCVRLLHLLAFSFSVPIPIMRVAEGERYQQLYMEDLFVERQRIYGPGRVKVMVMPGFYLPHMVFTAKVLCTYK